MEGSTVKKEARKKGRNVGKNLRVCSGSRGIRKWWALPISTAAHTHHVSIFKTFFFSQFSKFFFKTFLGPFPGPQGLVPTIFEFPYSRYILSNLFRRFDLFSCFLLRGTSFHLLQGLVNILFRSKVHVRPYPALYYLL